MMVVGSTTVPIDECSKYCLRKMGEDPRPGVNIKNCRKDCKAAEGKREYLTACYQMPVNYR